MFWRRKDSRKSRSEHRSDRRQVWLRDPSPLDAVAGQFSEIGPIEGADERKSKVYADEIDPAWADPDTAE